MHSKGESLKLPLLYERLPLIKQNSNVGSKPSLYQNILIAANVSDLKCFKDLNRPYLRIY